MFKNKSLFEQSSKLAMLIITALTVWARPGYADAPVHIYTDSPDVRALIAHVLAHNSELQIAQRSVLQRRSAQREVRAGYLPSVDLDARYTKLWGGIDLGELINPAYAALNQLTGGNQFPTDLSLRLPFPFESKVRISQPLWVPQLAGAAQLAAVDTRGKQIAVAMTRRELIAATRKLHLGMTSTRDAIVVLQTTRELLVENLRISELLVATEKSTQDTVLRATAQLAAHDQKIRATHAALRALQRRVAILSADKLEPAMMDVADPVATPQASLVTRAAMASAAIPGNVEALVTIALQRRSELAGITLQRRAADVQSELVDQGRLPTLAVALDLGLQSRSLNVAWQDRYAALSLVASWNIFDGGKRTQRRAQAALARESSGFAEQQQQAEIAAQVRTTWDAAHTARFAIMTIDERVTSERAAYQLLSQRFAAGSVAQIEVLAAQTALISAELERVLAAADLQQQLVELARLTEEPEQN